MLGSVALVPAIMEGLTGDAGLALTPMPPSDPATDPNAPGLLGASLASAAGSVAPLDLGLRAEYVDMLLAGESEVTLSGAAAGDWLGEWIDDVSNAIIADAVEGTDPGVHTTIEVIAPVASAEDAATQDGSASSFATQGNMASVVVTSDGNVIATGTDDDNVIVTGSGDDTVAGGGGADVISTAAGRDVVTGGRGADTVHAGSGDDTLIAALDDGDDVYEGGEGTDTYDLSGTSAGAKVVLGEAVASAPVSTAPAPVVAATTPAPVATIPVPVVSEINVTMPPPPAPAAAQPNDGSSTSYETGSDILRSIENVVGSSGDDTIVGSSGSNTLIGGKGNDEIHGDGSDEVVTGGSGSDILYGNDGDDLLGGGSGNDEIYGGDGSDILAGGKGNDLLAGGEGEDYFVFDVNFGNDRIEDFSVTGSLRDVIDLARDLGVSNFEDLMSGHAFDVDDEFGHHAQLRFDVNGTEATLDLNGVVLAQLIANDFRFH